MEQDGATQRVGEEACNHPPLRPFPKLLLVAALIVFGGALAILIYLTP